MRSRRMTWASIAFGAAVFLAGTVLRGRVPPLVLGTSAEFPPFEMRAGAAGTTIVGFDVDVAESIAAKAKRPLKIVDLPFDELIPALEQGRVEMVMAGLAVTEKRAERVNFSRSYHRTVAAEEEGQPPREVAYGVAVRKGDTERLDQINRALEELEADGTLARFAQRWKVP